VLVLFESVSIVLLGGAVGLGLAWAFVQNGDPTGGMLPAWLLPERDVALGVLLMVILGVVAGAMPAVSAMHLRITDALRRG
jgi:putative ABC transport system permease protein